MTLSRRNNCGYTSTVYDSVVYPKIRRETNRAWLDWIKTLQCLVGFSLTKTDCLGPVDPAHLKTRGSFGSDHTAVPLCRKHHGEQEGHADIWFQETYGINLWQELSQLLLLYISTDGKPDASEV